MAAGGSSRSGDCGVVVWEWEENGGVWVSYDSFVSTALEEALRAKKRRLKLGDVTSELELYEVDLKHYKQSRLDTGSSRHVRRTIFPRGSPQAHGVKWQWQERGHWLCYDNNTSSILEEHLQSSKPKVSLYKLNPKMPYRIDLQKCVQTNVHTRFSRAIQRVPLLQPYPSAIKEDHKGVPQNLSRKSSKSKTKKDSKPQKNAMDVEHYSQPSTGSVAMSSTKPWMSHCKVVSSLDSEAAKEDCVICFENLCQPSDYATSAVDPEALAVVSLKKCGHMFHKLCLKALCSSGTESDYIQCPRCKKIHGVRIGNQPQSGHMKASRLASSLPGYPTCGTIQIHYDFHGGVQGSEHPAPGKPYSAHGFPRRCYLPDNKDGNKVLRLLEVAWKRRLIFTIGASVTTGCQDTVVWNEIHHKTESTGNAGGHGYPDPNYISNVLAELAAQGVDDDQSV